MIASVKFFPQFASPALLINEIMGTSLLSNPSFAFQHSRILLCMFSVFVLALIAYFTAQSDPVAITNTTTEQVGDVMEGSLSSLAKALIPTQSIWPEFYLGLCNKVTRMGRERISLPTEMVLQDIIQGRLELRNPADLAVMMKGHFQTSSQKIVFFFSINERWQTLLWFLDVEFKPWKVPEVRKYQLFVDSLLNPCIA